MSDDPFAPASAVGVHRLAIPTPFAVGRVNCYLIEDEPLTLVDAGPNSGKALDELKAKGMLYNDIAPAELARMRAEVKPVHDKFAASYEPAVVNLFKSELERVSKL